MWKTASLRCLAHASATKFPDLHGQKCLYALIVMYVLADYGHQFCDVSVSGMDLQNAALIVVMHHVMGAVT